ncbi:MAG: response regulator [Treponema sp.]|jgi:two-component system chemotaxis response regulator CheY|nr:response regulator [Treponema sp.]
MKKIMVVDDSATIRNIIKNGLVSEFEVCEAEDGAKALQAIPESGTISLFLLDVNMPNMDGLTLLKHIRELDNYKKTPILMLTTETKEEFRSTAKNAGANGWIVKPCEPDKLLEAVKRILGI